MSAVFPSHRFWTDESTQNSITILQVVAGGNFDLNTRPFYISSVLNVDTAVASITVMSDVAITGTTTLSFDLYEASSLCGQTPIKRAEDFLAAPVSVPSALTTTSVELGKSLFLPMGMILGVTTGKYPPGGLRICVSGDAAATNTAPVVLRFRVETMQLPSAKAGVYTVGSTTGTAAT